MNKIIEYKNKAELVINSSKYGTFNIIIDLEDIDNCRKYNWSIYKPCLRIEIFYAINRDAGLLHRYLLNIPKGVFSDHINGNTLDCRKKNLRVVNRSKNNMNKGIYKNNTSGYTGITWHKRLSKWMAYIQVNDFQVTLGYYKELKDAIKVRRMAEVSYFGEYARTRKYE